MFIDLAKLKSENNNKCFRSWCPCNQKGYNQKGMPFANLREYLKELFDCNITFNPFNQNVYDNNVSVKPFQLAVQDMHPIDQYNYIQYFMSKCIHRLKISAIIKAQWGMKQRKIC